MVNSNNTVKTVLSILKWTIVLSIINSVFIQFIEVFVINTTGDFADNILKGEISSIKGSVELLAISLVFTIIMIPALRYIKNKSLLCNGLVHDEYIFSKFIRQKLKYLKNFKDGELHYRVQDDPIELRCYINSSITGIVTLIIVVLGTLYIMGNIRWDMAILTIAISLLSVVAPIITRRLQKILYKNNKDINGKIVNLERNAVENMSYIKVEGLEKSIYSRYEQYLEELYKTVKVTIRLDILVISLNKFIAIVCEVLIYILISYYIAKSYITLGEAVKFFGIYVVLKSNFSHIEKYIKQINIVMVSKERVYDLICDEEIQGKETFKNIEEITLDNVTFGYDENVVLRNISFNVKKGDKLLIIGDNGIGKSTLIKVLMGLYDDYNGKIFINGTELRNVNKDWLRDEICVVSQNPYIINDSLYNNLTLGRKYINRYDLKRIIREFSLEEIEDKKLGENGAYISGGQRQKISLGRAFLSKSSVIILDEPTSFLDKEAMDDIINKIKELNSTCIVISHEASITEAFDNVYTFIGA